LHAIPTARLAEVDILSSPLYLRQVHLITSRQAAAGSPRSRSHARPTPSTRPSRCSSARHRCLLLAGLLRARCSCQGGRGRPGPRRLQGQAASIARLRLRPWRGPTGIDPSVLAERLLEDHPSGWTAATGLMFVDDSDRCRRTRSGCRPPGPTLRADLFLHSFPGGTKVSYLDFDGHNTTAHLEQRPQRTRSSPSLSDLDGNPPAGARPSRDIVRPSGSGVAEDFLPYGVDVTTQDPGSKALRKTSSGDEYLRPAGSHLADQLVQAPGPGRGLHRFVQLGSDTPC